MLHKMTCLANLNGVSSTLPSITNLPNTHRNPKRRRRQFQFQFQFQIVGLQGSRTQQPPQQCPGVITRRAAIGLVSFILTANSTHNKSSLALDNGFWYEEPLPSPSISNRKLSSSSTFFLVCLNLNSIDRDFVILMEIG